MQRLAQIRFLFSTIPTTPHTTVTKIINLYCTMLRLYCIIALFIVFLLYHCMFCCILLWHMYRPRLLYIFSNSAAQLQVCHNKVELSELTSISQGVVAMC